MRLIRSTLQGKPCLTSFSESTIPPYAVLSHTWETQDQEVTLKDMLESSGRTKAGYRKVEFCGDQTQKDNLEYFWVDSCCIDRSSSAELSRSINSMFRWYQNAQKCYVYLQDVSTLKGDDRESWEPSFRNSRWFTRGWTLQELLAPKTVEFYSKEGQKLGDRKTLEGPVHEATGIARKALQGTPLTQFDVEERFSWVYKRQTSEPEDKAYSMLGIFDVSLPLVYGEGEIHALRRLREAIARENSITVNIGLPAAENYTPQRPSTRRGHEGSPERINGVQMSMPFDPTADCMILVYLGGPGARDMVRRMTGANLKIMDGKQQIMLPNGTRLIPTPKMRIDGFDEEGLDFLFPSDNKIVAALRTGKVYEQEKAGEAVSRSCVSFAIPADPHADIMMELLLGREMGNKIKESLFS